MELEPIVQWLAGLHPVVHVVLVVLGSLVVLGGVYVKLTPTQSDDAWFAKLEAIPVLGALLRALVKFSPVARKE